MGRPDHGVAEGRTGNLGEGAQKVDAFARCCKAVAAIPRRRLTLKPFAQVDDVV
jgi:hypothetical protein